MEEVKNKDMIPGIYVVEYPAMSNMTMERIVVSNPAILEILKLIKLTVDEQQEAVDDLVARTPDWMELEAEEQITKIKSVLTMESVIEYLRSIETLRPQCDIVDVGVDAEGSIVVEAYYVKMNREQRRAMEKAASDEDKSKLAQVVNQFDLFAQEGNLIDLAKKKMEKLQGRGMVKKKQ